ncbi:MAG: hydrogenase nickel incorporation protein HypB [Planctomycetota bacterium]|jgi:hydrogenase nickel incorporation protein HypB
MKIKVVENVLKANESVAEGNRQFLNGAHILGVNLMSSPGSGKTALLERTIGQLGADIKCGVLVGDLQTTRDAERLVHLAVEVTQINTGAGCHLAAGQVAEGLKGLELDGLAYLFIENVGNMVCPASFDLGEHVKVVLLSVPEGDDKVAKYPVLFQRADAILLTKVDLIGVLDFDRSRVLDDISQLNTRAQVIELSSKTGQGLDKWLDWLDRQRIQRFSAIKNK